MPPRHAYWTILIDEKPTAFRAREREELQPTFVQLQRKNSNVTMQWFARGKLWASREAEQEDFQRQKQAASAPRDRRAPRPEGAERRGSDWRPGGAHKDPRDRFKKKNRPERAWSEKDPATQRDRDKPGYAANRPPGGGWRDKPQGPPRGDRPPAHRSSFDRKPGGGGWNNKPSGDPRRRPPDRRPAGFVPNDRPWQTKPTGPRAQRKPWIGKPGPPGKDAGVNPRGDRPWSNKPPTGEKRPWSNKPPTGEKRPWSDKPPTGEKRPWSNKPPTGEKRPWSNKPPTGEKRPWSPKPPGGGWNNRPPPGDTRPWSGKPREDKRSAGGGPPHGDQKAWQKKPFRPGGPPRPDTRGRGAGPRKRRDDEPPDRD